MGAFSYNINMINEMIASVNAVKNNCATLRRQNATLENSLNHLASQFDTTIKLTGQQALNTKIKELNDSIEPNIEAVIAACDYKLTQLNSNLTYYQALEQQSLNWV